MYSIFNTYFDRPLQCNHFSLKWTIVFLVNKGEGGLRSLWQNTFLKIIISFIWKRIENLYFYFPSSAEIMYHQSCPDRTSLPWQSCLTSVSDRLVALLASGMRSDVTLHLEGRTLKVSTKTVNVIIIIVAIFLSALPSASKYFINGHANRTSMLSAHFFFPGAPSDPCHELPSVWQVAV